MYRALGVALRQYTDRQRVPLIPPAACLPEWRVRYRRQVVRVQQLTCGMQSRFRMDTRFPSVAAKECSASNSLGGQVTP